MSSNVEASDRRSARRLRGIHKGLIIFSGSNCTQPCAILDISETGARLRPLDSFTCPDRFQLRDNKSAIRECTVVWRQGSSVGVRFD
ncbi:MAG: PilZ domain-containing protein [Rhodovibrionaceae bacterium]